MKNPPRLASWLVLAALLACGGARGDILVKDQAEYELAAKYLSPGDTIVLADGEWRDFEILFTGQGTAEEPITLTAETKGKVFLTGQSNLRLAGKHLVVSGLVFRDGYSPTNTVIAFRRTRGDLAYHTRVTEVVIDHFNNPERFETDFWVMMYGKHNRFDHNHLEGKSNSGVTMAVRLDSEESQNNYHRIDHNYFGPRPVLGSNGGETLRIGTSKYSLTDSYTTVENNYFDRCNGEVEIVSSKSGRNSFRGNVFFESTGTLTLRHGNDNVVEGNVFLGNGVDHTGGIRVINKRQTVRNNYLEGLKGYRFGGALVIMNGVPDSPINRYHQVEDSLIENNSIIDSDHIELAAGSDQERSAPPVSTSFRNNLIANSKLVDSIAVHDDISGISFRSNVASNVKALPSESGFEHRSVRLAKGGNGLRYPVSKDLSGIGAPRSLTVLRREETGPTWYEKPGYGSIFEGGRSVRIRPGEDSLAEAVAASGAGDVIELSEGAYNATRIIRIEHPLTIRGIAESRKKPAITFERSVLFELADGGSLQLENVIIDGSVAPDAYGNAALRTSRYSMLNNYQLLVRDLDVYNLNTNHSFNFLNISKHTFAQRISIRDSHFQDVTGHVVALDRETDDLGIYNGEYITVADSTFRNIGKSVASIYRGGTDESTFGPHFVLQNSRLEGVGKAKRNKSRASVFLHGVQVAEIFGNRFTSSRPVRIVETVGEPQSSLSGNEFVDTPVPVILDVNELSR